MTRKVSEAQARQKIDAAGALLVFPVNNHPQPRSLWSEFFPRVKMRWEWNETGDNRVGEMWLLMKWLSESRDVVYSKWYQGRATFFARPLFQALMTVQHAAKPPAAELSPTARLLLETLEADSPLSTKQLKKLTELRGRDNEPTYSRGMKELFSRFLIVGCGEVEDGAFPSLAVGATSLVYEALWEAARRPSAEGLRRAQRIIDSQLPMDSAFRKFFERTLS